MKTKSDYRKSASGTGSTGLAQFLQLSNAERCKRYRLNKKKSQPNFQEDEKERQRQRRLSRSAEQIQRDRDTAKERMRRLRERKAANSGQTSSSLGKAKTVILTRHQTESQRLKWKNAKKKYRNGLSAQKKWRIREADRLRKEMKSLPKDSKENNSTSKCCTSTQSKYTPEAERKAIYRVKCKMPKETGKYASVVKGLIKTATPRKRHAIEAEMPIQVLTPRKKKRLEFCDKAMQSFQESYNNLKRSRKQKDIKARKVLATQLARIRKYRLLKFCSGQVGIRYKSLLKWSKLDAEDCTKGKRSDALSEEFVQNVQDFFVKPTISVTHAGKKTVLKREMKQRHTLNYTLEAAHQKFKAEYQSNISFSKFASLKPKHVETVGKRIYSGCLCEQCTNIELKLKGLNRKLDHKDIIKNKYVANEMTLCEYEKGSHPKLQCVKRECVLCGTKRIREKLHDLRDSKEEAVWCQWETKQIKNLKTNSEHSRKMLVQHVGTYQEFMNCLVKSLETFSMHLFVAHWQHQQFLKAKEGLVEGQVLCVMDFAENMTLRNQDECQSAHWFAQQVTIHPVVCYHLAQVKDKDDLEKTPDRRMVTHEIIFISDDLTHDAHMVEHCVTETLRLLGETFPIKHMIQFTDGCSAQYKSKTPFADISLSETDHRVKVERHFFGTSHGKGPADGCSGVVKSAVSRALKAGTVLNSGSDMYAFCKESLSKSINEFCRTFVYIDSESVDRNRPERVAGQTIKGTRQLHAVKSFQPGSLAVRKLSCCCNFCLNGEGYCPNSTIVDEWKIENIFKKNLKTSKRLIKAGKSNTPKSVQKHQTAIPCTEETRGQTDSFTDMPADEETKYAESVSKHNMPRDQYFSAKLQELSSCGSYDTLHKKCLVMKVEFDMLYPIQANENINILDSKLTADEVACQLVPDDVKKHCTAQLPVLVVGDGNCLPRCGSILVFGHELAHEEIRARIAVEMVYNKTNYTDNTYLNRGIALPEKEKHNLVKTYTMFSDKYMNEVITRMTTKNIFQAEAIDVTKLGSYMGIWQLFALSTVLKCTVRSVYPSLGAAVPRLLLNRVIFPACDASLAEVKIMWSSTRHDMSKEHWIPNHFVPILSMNPISEATDFDSDISLNLSNIVDTEDLLLDVFSLEQLFENSHEIEPYPVTVPDQQPDVTDPECVTVPDQQPDVTDPDCVTVPDQQPDVTDPDCVTVPDQQPDVADPDCVTVPDQQPDVADPDCVTVPDQQPDVTDPDCVTVPDQQPDVTDPDCVTVPDQQPDVTDPDPVTLPDQQPDVTDPDCVTVPDQQPDVTDPDCVTEPDPVTVPDQQSAPVIESDQKPGCLSILLNANLDSTPLARVNVGAYVKLKYGSQILPAVVVDGPQPLWVRYFKRGKKNLHQLEDMAFTILADDICEVIDAPELTMVGSRSMTS